jgi:hypothetical protein
MARTNAVSTSSGGLSDSHLLKKEHHIPIAHIHVPYMVIPETLIERTNENVDLSQCAQRVSIITFIWYAQGQKIKAKYDNYVFNINTVSVPQLVVYYSMRISSSQ